MTLAELYLERDRLIGIAERHRKARTADHGREAFTRCHAVCQRIRDQQEAELYSTPPLRPT